LFNFVAVGLQRTNQRGELLHRALKFFGSTRVNFIRHVLEDNHARQVICRIPGASSLVVSTASPGIFGYAAQAPAFIGWSKAMVAGKAIEFSILRPNQALLPFSSLCATSQPAHALFELNRLSNAPLAYA